LNKIFRVLNESGIELTAHNGVQEKLRDLELYEGSDRYDEFYDFVYHHLKTFGGNVCVSGANAKKFASYRKDPEIHRSRMRELQLGRKDSLMRLLIEEGDMSMPNTTYAKYRWLKKEYFSPTAFYVFGSCVAQISFEGTVAPFIVLIKSAVFADAYRKSFDLAWRAASPPPSTSGAKAE